MAPTDPDLVQACIRGSEQAWSALIDRYSALILSVPRRYGLTAATSDDVFAEVCLALVKSLPSLRDARALPSWLIRTATRATWEASRKSQRKPPDDLPLLTGAAPPDEFIELIEEEQIVREALGSISERCRELLELLYFRAPTPSYDDIADIMGMPRGSLGPTRRRCLESMRTQLTPKLGGDVSNGGNGPPRS